MRRRRFLLTGTAAAAAPAVLPLLPHRAQAAPAVGRATAAAVRRRAGRRPLLAVERLGLEPPLLPGELRLNANENPLGPSAAAREAAVGALDLANRYSSGARGRLREALAAKHGVEPEGIVLGNGSTELIQMAIQSLVEPGYTVISATPTFDDVARYAEPSRVEVVTVPLTEDLQHDLGAMERAARRVSGTALIYVCNPNNPTGTVTSCPDLAALIDRLPPDVHVLVDEAYFEYAEDPTYRSFDRVAFENPNVVVLRTFSKVHGMAGMRLGYAVAHPTAAERLDAFAADVNADQLAIAAALASLEDDDHVRRSVETARRARDVLYRHLEALEISYVPTQASFVMHRIRGDLETYGERMREAGFRVGRPFPPMLEHNRLSLGTPEDMERFGETLAEFREKGWV